MTTLAGVQPDGHEFRWFPQDMTAWDIAFYVVLFIGLAGLLIEAWGTLSESGYRDHEQRIEHLRNLKSGWLAFIITDLFIWAFRFWRHGLVALGLPEWASWLLGLIGLIIAVILIWVSMVAEIERFWAWFLIFVLALGAGFGYVWVGLTFGQLHFGQ